MSDESTSDSDESTLNPRTRRARTEDMLVALRKTDGIYTVRGESGNTYRVDITIGECSCPDYRKSSTERCKHLRRVEIEIQNGSVPTPDGRLPERPVADGGVDANIELEQSQRRRITGPLPEFNKHGQPTGAEYYRCTACGAEAMRQRDLSDCCPSNRD